MLITFELVADEWDACYRRGLLRILFAEPLTPLQVLTKRDTPEWEAVPDKDRVWTVLRHEVLSIDQIMRFAQACADRAKESSITKLDYAELVRHAGACSSASIAAYYARVVATSVDYSDKTVADIADERRKQIEWLVNELSPH